MIIDFTKMEGCGNDYVYINVPFHRYDVQTDRALKEFRKAGFDDKVKLLETSGEAYTDYYTLDETVDYYYGKLVPSTGDLKVFQRLFHLLGQFLHLSLQTFDLRCRYKAQIPAFQRDIRVCG